MKNTFKLTLSYYCDNGGQYYYGTVDISEDNCANWQDVTLAYKRADYDGVVRSFTTSFEFIGDAKDTVLTCLDYWGGFDMLTAADFNGRGNGDYCRVELYLLQEDWTFPAEPIYQCDLDFSTLKMTRDKITIAAVDNSLAAVLKNAGSTKYTITPFEAQEWVLPTAYNGLKPLERYYLDIGIPTGSAGAYVGTTASFAISYNGDNSEDFAQGRSYGGREVYLDGVKVYVVSSSDGSEIRKSIPIFSNSVHDYTAYSPRKVTFSAKSNVHIKAVLTWTYTASSQQTLSLIRRTSGGTEYTLASDTGTVISQSGNTYTVYYLLEASGVTTTHEDVIDIVFNGTVTDYGSISEDYDAMIYVTMPSTAQRTVLDFPSITAEGIADCLSAEIFGGTRTQSEGNPAILVDTSGDSRLDLTRIFSGGWFNRGFTTDENGTWGAMDISYNDFKEWMLIMFDYIPVLTDGGDATNSYVTFKPRSEVFVESNPTITLDEDDVAEANLTIKSAQLCRRVIAGYTKQDYDVAEYNSGGFCVPVTYEPTIPASTDKELKLQSNWLADTYALEALVDDFDGESTDSGSIYFLYCTEDPQTIGSNSYYIPDRSIAITSTQTDPQLAYYVNAPFSPRAILLQHGFSVLPALGVPATAQIDYVSQEGGNPNLSIGGVAVTSGVTFSQADFEDAPRPCELTFTTSRQAWGKAYADFITSISEDFEDADNLLLQVLDSDAAILPAAYAGLVQVEADGLQYVGWISDCKFHILHHEEVQCTLIVKSIKKI